MEIKGQKFEVFASKTKAELAEAAFEAAHPGALGFPTDGTQIRFNGKWYGNDDTIKPYIYKGTYGSLGGLLAALSPAKTEVGWTYNIEQAFTFGGKEYPAGTNVACKTEVPAGVLNANNFATYFDPLGGEMDVFTTNTPDNTVATLATGIKVSQLKGKSMSQVVDALFFPTLLPALVASSIPNAAISGKSNGALVEYNSNTYKAQNFAGLSYTPAAKFLPVYKYEGGAEQKGDVQVDTEGFTSSNSTGKNTSSEKISITLTYSAETVLNIPVDNKGNYYPAARYGGGTKSAEITLYAFYPVFIPGGTDKDTLTKGSLSKKAVTPSASNIEGAIPNQTTYPNNFQFTTGDATNASQKNFFAIKLADASPTEPLVYIKNNLNSGKFEKYNGTFTKSTVTQTLNGAQVTYTKYTLNDTGALGSNTFLVFYKAALNA